MRSLFRICVIPLLVALSAAKSKVETGEEPFSSHVVRKTLDNGTIVEYEYLYYYDENLEEEQDSLDFDDVDDEPAVVQEEALATFKPIVTTSTTRSTYTTPTSTAPADLEDTGDERETNSVRFSEISFNEVTQSPTFALSSFSNRARLQNRPRLDPFIVTEAPQFIPIIKNKNEQQSANTARVQFNDNRGASRFFGSRSRGQGIRQSSQGTNQITPSLKSDVEKQNKQQETTNSVTRNGVSENADRFTATSDNAPVRTNSVAPRRSQSRFSASSGSNRQALLESNRRRRPRPQRPVETVSQDPANQTAQPARSPSRSSRFRTRGRAESSKASSKSTAKNNEHIPAEEVAQKQGITRDQTRHNEAASLGIPFDLHQSREAKKLSRGGDRLQAVTPATHKRGRLPQGTRFPPRSTATERPSTTSPPEIPKSGPQEKTINQENVVPQVDTSSLYSLSRVEGSDNTISVDISTTESINTSEDTSVEDGEYSTIPSETSTVLPTDDSIQVTKKSTLLGLEVSRPRPTKIIELVPLPPVTDNKQPIVSTPLSQGDAEHSLLHSTATHPSRQNDTEHIPTISTANETIAESTGRDNTHVDSVRKPHRHSVKPTEPVGRISARRPGASQRRTSFTDRRKQNPTRAVSNENTKQNRPSIENEEISEQTKTATFARAQLPRRRAHGRRRRPFHKGIAKSEHAEEIKRSENLQEKTNTKLRPQQTENIATTAETDQTTESINSDTKLRGRGSLSAKIKLNDFSSDSVQESRHRETVSIASDQSNDEKENSGDRRRFRSQRRRPSRRRNTSRDSTKTEVPTEEKSATQTSENEAQNIAQSVESQKVSEPPAQSNLVAAGNNQNTNAGASSTRFRGITSRQRRPQRPAPRSTPNVELTTETIKTEQSEIESEEQRKEQTEPRSGSSLRSRSSRRRSFRRKNSRPRGLLPAIKATTAEPEETTTTITEENEEQQTTVNQAEESATARTEPAFTSKLHSHSASKDEDEDEKHENEQTEEATDANDVDIEESSGEADEKEDEAIVESGVVSGNRKLRFTTARKAPSVRDRNSLPVQRSLFGAGRRRPLPFRRSRPSSRAAEAKTVQATSATVATVSTERPVNSRTEQKEETASQKIVSRTEQKAPISRKPFEKPFSQNRTGNIAERRRKYVPGGLRRPSGSGLRALSPLSFKRHRPSGQQATLNQPQRQHHDNPALKRQPTTSAASTAEQPATEKPATAVPQVEQDEGHSATEESTIAALTTSRPRVRPIAGANRRRAGRNTKLSLSEQLHLLNG